MDMVKKSFLNEEIKRREHYSSSQNEANVVEKQHRRTHIIEIDPESK